MSRTLAAAVLLLVTACGGGGGGDNAVRQGDGTPSPRPSDVPQTILPASPTPSPSSVSKHGSAEVRYRGKTYQWAERNCEATRGLDGKVVGWMATFQDVTEQTKRFVAGITDSKSYVQIRLRGYTGAGTYPSERLSLRLADDRGSLATVSGFGTPGQRLVLREGGKEGTFESKDVSVKFSCDPADDTSTEAGDPVAETPAPGTAYVVRPEGAVFTFPTVRCGEEGGDTSVTAGTFPHFFRLRAADKPGSGAARVLYGVHGIVIRFDYGSTRSELRGDPLESGTFRYSPSGPNATTDVTRGAFACG